MVRDARLTACGDMSKCGEGQWSEGFRREVLWGEGVRRGEVCYIKYEKNFNHQTFYVK